jgi:hypothetical protein
MSSWIPFPATERSNQSVWNNILSQLKESFLLSLISGNEKHHIMDLALSGKGKSWFDNVEQEYKDIYGAYYENALSQESIYGGDGEKITTLLEYDVTHEIESGILQVNGYLSPSSPSFSKNSSSSARSQASYKIKKDLNRTFNLFCKSSSLVLMFYSVNKNTYLNSLYRILLIGSSYFEYCQV